MVERAALGVVVEPVGAATDDQFALVGLRHVAMHGVGHDDHVDGRLDWLGHQRLQGDRFHRQAETGLARQVARVARDHDGQLVTGNVAQSGLNPPGDLATRLIHTGDFAFLDDVHAHVGTGASIAPPGHGVVTRGATARLPQAPSTG